jgi:hypothetical protein
MLLMYQLQIINHSNDDFDFPESVPEVAQDLIRKLLVQVRLQSCHSFASDS